MKLFFTTRDMDATPDLNEYASQCLRFSLDNFMHEVRAVEVEVGPFGVGDDHGHLCIVELTLRDGRRVEFQQPGRNACQAIDLAFRRVQFNLARWFAPSTNHVTALRQAS